VLDKEGFSNTSGFITVCAVVERHEHAMPMVLTYLKAENLHVNQVVLMYGRPLKT
jgi:hypothetical protein